MMMDLFKRNSIGRITKAIVGFVVLLVVSISCSQPEGIGGNSHIEGVLIERCYNQDLSVLLYERTAKDEDIYIQFGDDSFVGDDVTTSYDGRFQFQYLWPGDYRLFYYSDDTTMANQPGIEIIKDITLDKNETLNLDTLYTYKVLDFDEGRASIQGVLIEKYYNNDFSVFQYQLPAKDEDVFVLYGNESTYNDKTSTSYNGAFSFKNLWPGSYELFYYSDDNINLENDNVEIIVNAELDIDDALNLDTLYLYKALDFDEGKASIKGKVMLINYKDGELPDLVIKDITPAQELDVYLVYNDAEMYNERIRTMDDGTFEFPNLLKGKYKIFVYSDDVRNDITNMIIMSATIEITETNQSISLDTFVIEKI